MVFPGSGGGGITGALIFVLSATGGGGMIGLVRGFVEEVGKGFGYIGAFGIDCKGGGGSTGGGGMVAFSSVFEPAFEPTF